MFGVSGSERKVYFLCFADLHNSPSEKQLRQQISYWKPQLTARVEQFTFLIALAVQMAWAWGWVLMTVQHLGPWVKWYLPLPPLSSEPFSPSRSPLKLQAESPVDDLPSGRGAGLPSKKIFSICGIGFVYPLNRMSQRTNKQWIGYRGFIIICWFLFRDHPH